MNQRQTAATAVTTLSETFRQPLTEAAVEGYLAALDDMPPELIRVALKRALRECRFMPAPAELRDLAGVSGPRVTALRAAEAWGEVVQAIRRHDYTTSVDFGPLVNAVLRNMGGWQAACNWTRAELETWKRKEFERVFELFAGKDGGVLQGDPLAGAFGGVPVLVPIAGVTPARQLPPPSSKARDLVRALADGKAAG